MKELVNPKEKVTYICCMIVSVLILLLAIISLTGIVYLIIIPIVFASMHGIFIANIRGNGIKISENQFPEIYELANKYSNMMDMDVPDIYVIEAGGILNACATRFARRDFVILYSDILDMAYNEGENVVSFILCHELAHVKRKHVKRWFIKLSMVIPALWNSYSRACEYTCDAIANSLVPEGAIQGLVLLAAGKNLYKKVNLEELENQKERETGFFMWLGEIHSTHPYLTHRISKLKSSGNVMAVNSITEGF